MEYCRVSRQDKDSGWGYGDSLLLLELVVKIHGALDLINLLKNIYCNKLIYTFINFLKQHKEMFHEPISYYNLYKRNNSF
jgi:hypothetical protein